MIFNMLQSPEERLGNTQHVDFDPRCSGVFGLKQGSGISVFLNAIRVI